MSTGSSTPLIEDIELHITMLHFISNRRSFAKSVFNREWIKFKIDYNCNESPSELKDLFHCDLMKKDLKEEFNLDPKRLDYFKHANFYANHSIEEIRAIFLDSETVVGTDFRFIAVGFNYSSDEDEDEAVGLMGELKLKNSLAQEPQGWFKRPPANAPNPIKVQSDPILPPNFKRPMDQEELDREADWITLGSLSLITPTERAAGVTVLTSEEITQRFLDPQVDALSNLPLSILKYLSDTKIFGDDLEPLIASKEKTLLYDTDPTVRDIEYDSSSDEEPSRPSSSLNSISFVSVIQSTPTHQDQPLASSSLDNSNNSMVKPANTSASSNDSSTITERGPSTTGRHVAGNARMDKFMKHFRDQRR